ncbi:MAG: multicopper oxidase domain-containing protein [Rhodospirillales bacterium]|nr:multicopper oxidase domain-containing protein [Rhodospirillales bacterium]
MVKRRDAMRIGLGAAASGALARTASAQAVIPQTGLVFPDGYTPGFLANPSPPATPFVMPLNVMPVARPVPESAINPPPDPSAHQRYNEFPPKKFYIQNISEFKWLYHKEGPYGNGSWAYGFNGITPGETFHAWYGEPIFVRRPNHLPPVGTGNIGWALPSYAIHLHNAHTASESDGYPGDFADPGEFWDHHYPNIESGFDPRNRLSTLWYHDHRLDFTAPNVYAGLSAFYLLFDEKDSNNERDKRRGAFRLPSGKYDVPLLLHDIWFDQNGQPGWDFVNPRPIASSEVSRGGYLPGPTYTNNGMLGDRFTVNRIIQPYFQVERRKYRFRLLNGGPSRFYHITLSTTKSDAEPFYVLSNDGNLLPEPILVESLEIWDANRYDMIVDLSKYNAGDQIFLTNWLEMRPDGAGETGRMLKTPNQIMRFDVVGPKVEDPSRIPDFMRALPPIDMSQVKRHRLWNFDYVNGLWTINGRLMDPNRIDAAIEQGSAEIWTLRNNGDAWSHPIHSHFEEFQILEINGQKVKPGSINWSRKDVVQLGPMTSVTFYGHWRDFLGKYVMHCHNVVHEDHAMMLRWDIVPPGQGY